MAPRQTLQTLSIEVAGTNPVFHSLETLGIVTFTKIVLTNSWRAWAVLINLPSLCSLNDRIDKLVITACQKLFVIAVTKRFFDMKWLWENGQEKKEFYLIRFQLLLTGQLFRHNNLYPQCKQAQP